MDTTFSFTHAMKRVSIFLALFVAACAIELLALTLDWQLAHFVSKPLIMLSLIGYYLGRVSKRSLTFITALYFCWVGDVLLLFQTKGEIFFILGLVTFLIGHVLYILAYQQFRWNDKKNELIATQKIRFCFPIILAGTGLIVILYPLLGDLKIPVLVYAIVLMVMVMTALFRYGRTTVRSFWMVFGGAAIFMSSDFLLAINKFYSPIYLSGLFIMLTYTTAQYLIVEGVLSHREEIQG